jgi:hypothetical protein
MGKMTKDEPWQQWVHPSVIAQILPALASEAKADWSKPLNDWTREEMINFLELALELIREAMAARMAAIPFDDSIPF